ncbi:MAG TPA: hypothetical protein PLD47_08795 [Aggregatilineales bacterium]|nr:hypothetical protein [Anaerolineales bacterium]HRE47810.1 hypothetical protein [Aggregatilineales bacterium]
MRTLSILLALIVMGTILAGCGSQPPLKSVDYLDDLSLISDDPCAAPCFAEIIPGKTTFADAVAKVEANKTRFKDLQKQDNPPQAAWADGSKANGQACCQVTANANTGLVDAILIRIAPNVTVKQILAKYGDPEYVSVVQQDYSSDEAVIGLVYPKTGNVLWVMPGNGSSDLDENDPIVLALYFDPAAFGDLLDTATLSKWEGFKTLAAYRAATPIVTPKPTLTATP